VTPFHDDPAVIPAVPGPDDPDDPRDDSLATELAKAAPRHWWNRGTLVLGSVALLLGGFLGGLQAQKHWGTAPTPAAGARAAAGFAGQNRAGYGAAGGNFGGAPGALGGTPGGAAPGGAAAPSAAASGTTGTVKLVDGRTIYVQTADGNVVTVKTDGRTTVSAATKATLKDVTAGQSITVRGAAATDGTVTATSVTTQQK
jgi:hypothetical protein